jgi:hypothetical protein
MRSREVRELVFGVVAGVTAVGIGITSGSAALAAYVIGCVTTGLALAWHAFKIIREETK